MDKLFQLQAHQTTISREVLSGLTTFLTMSYILFVNPSLLSESGMPAAAVFAATILIAALGSFLLAFVANVPLAMAPGMGINTFFTYTVCGVMGFHWREGLALVFLTGVLHLVIMGTGLRKALVRAIPGHLKLAFGVGLGFFIAYIGLKSAGFLKFTIPFGQYELQPGGAMLGNSSTVPAFATDLGLPQALALIGLSIMIILLALERKTGESYAALPMGIIGATAIGIPLGITSPAGLNFIDFSSLAAIKEVAFGFFGRPGFLSLCDDPHRAFLALLMVSSMLLTNVIDSVGTIMGIGQMRDAALFDAEDQERFERPGLGSRMDRTLLANSLGGGLAALTGTTTATTYMESITGIVSGGRTGLSALVVGLMFLVCLPLAKFFNIIPAQAIAPALIVAGSFMIPLAARIDWSNFEESFPAFVTILCIPTTYGFVCGIAAGVLSHILVQIALGKARQVHWMLYLIALIFILTMFEGAWQ